MAAGIRLKWAQHGDFDYFEVLRSNTTMNSSALPDPIATGLTKMTYFDGSVVLDGTYFYRVVAVKGESRVVSEEIKAIATYDQYRSNVITFLFLNNNLLEKVSSTNFIWSDQSSPALFVNSRFGKSLSLDGTYGRFVSDPRTQNADTNLSGGAFTIEFFAKLKPTSTGTRTVLSFGSVTWDRYLSWWVSLNIDSFGFVQSNDGSGSNTQGMSVAMPANINPTIDYIHYAISKDQSGNTRLYINGVLVIERTLNSAFYVSAYGLRIGRLDYPSYSYEFIGEVGPVRITKGIARYTEKSFVPPSDFAGFE